MSIRQPDLPYIPALDGLRGLAILLVIGFHYLAAMRWGWIGVDLFFVLSGFLITAKLLDTVGRKYYFWVFYARRILRIAPLYAVVLLLLFVLFPWLAPRHVTASFEALLQHQAYYWLFLVNIYDALHGWPANITVVHFWSLACEMQFYLLWPFLVLVLHGRMRLMIWVLVLLVLLALFWRIWGDRLFAMQPLYRYVLLPSRMDAFSIGALACLCYQRNCRFVSSGSFFSWSIILLLLLIGLGIFTGGWRYANEMISKMGYTLNALFWGVFLLSAVTVLRGPEGPKAKGSVRRFVQVIMEGKLMRTAGKYSYGMYVFHLPVFIAISKFANLEEGLKAATAFSITIGLSLLSFHLLEYRMMKLKPALRRLEDGNAVKKNRLS